MRTDPGFWRELRKDFEGLDGHVFNLLWYTVPPIDDILGTVEDSHWRWSKVRDRSLQARLRAMALRGAIGLGYSSEDDWYERLRESAFVRFALSGAGQAPGPDGSFVSWEFGPLNDVVKESITLCHDLESRAENGDPPESLARIHSVLHPEFLDLTETVQGADLNNDNQAECKKHMRKAFMAPYLERQTLSAIAVESGVGHSSLHRWSSGLTRLRADNRAKLADYLRVPPSDIPN